jgi:penicillin-binding protein 1B
MTRQAFLLRCREALASIRARVSRRLVLRVICAVTALGVFTIAAEAVVRAHLDSPVDRVPTALYTRPNSWKDNGERRPAIAIGSLDGAPLEQRAPVGLGELPDQLIQAVLAVEDQRFYQHHGLDVRRIGGALVANVKALGITQGGSTITQQLAKNLFLSAGRTPLRKLREAAIAVVLELRYDKPAILEAYLNEIYLGQDGGRAIHGVGAAARYYFGKEVRRLSLAESALLAGMIHAPNRHAPTRHPKAARERRDLVLQLMAGQQRISRASAERARRAGVSTRAWPAVTVDARHFRDFVSATAGSRLPARGMAVYTTLDASLQRAAERAVRSGLDRLRAPDVEAALVALDPRSGEVLAMIGGRDYGASQFDRATAAKRQPGSAFKPVVALAALERREGENPAFTLASVVDDEPLSVATPAGPWEPTNYDRRFRGRVTLREAMEQSLNVPFARIGLAVGPERIVATARRLGITSPLTAVPSLALGSSEVTPLELVRAYGVLAAGGELAPTRILLGRGRYGERVERGPAAEATRVIDPAVTYLVTSTLEGVIARGTGRALNAAGRFEAIAGKTGTSNEWRDAWFVAYTPSLVVGVWVGFDDGRSLRMTGASAALPIVARFLQEAASDESWESFPVPEGISERYVAIADGGWLGECGSREYFLEGTEPAGSECLPFAIPDWDQPREWGRVLKRGAVRFLEELIAQQLEQRRSRR